jgi:hypothetical protein
VSFCGNAPTLLLGLVVRRHRDRASRRLHHDRAWILLALTSSALALLTASGHLTLWQDHRDLDGVRRRDGSSTRRR